MALQTRVLSPVRLCALVPPTQTRGAQRRSSSSGLTQWIMIIISWRRRRRRRMTQMVAVSSNTSFFYHSCEVPREPDWSHDPPGPSSQYSSTSCWTTTEATDSFLRHFLFLSPGSGGKHPKCDWSSADQEHGALKWKTLVIFFKRLCPGGAESSRLNWRYTWVVWRSGRSLKRCLGGYIYTRPSFLALGASEITLSSLVCQTESFPVYSCFLAPPPALLGALPY